MSQRTALVVDDDASIRLLCRVNLELDGWRVLDEGSLAGARRALESEAVDVVLLDVHVAGDNGLRLLAELRERPGAPPVAMLTGSSDLGVIRAAGPDAVIEKPFTLELLLETVGRIAASR